MNCAPLPLLVAFTIAFSTLACTPSTRPAVPPVPASDPRVAVGEPKVNPRTGQPGAPVDCSVDVGNRSGQALGRLIVRCELLDEGGVPIGVGLGSVGNLVDGETRSIRTVVFGVRTFASARAVVTPAAAQ